MMRKLSIGLLIFAMMLSAGCAATKPITKTIDTVERVHSTAGKVYDATKAVSNLVNPLELIFLSVPAEQADSVWGVSTAQAVEVYDKQSGELVGVIRRPGADAVDDRE